MRKPAMLQVKGLALRCAFGLLSLLFLSSAARAQDVRVNCAQNPTCTLTPAGGIAWGSGNLTYIFRPMAPNVSLYVYVHNNNPTNAHTSQTLKIFQTPYGQDAATSLSLTSSKWNQDAVTQNTTAGASCNSINALNDSSPGASGMGSCYVNTMFAAQIAIQITGATTAAGSPDTYDLLIVQQTGTPGGPVPGAGQYATSVSQDPCLSSWINKTTVHQAFGAAGTTQLVALAVGKSIFVCALHLELGSQAAASSIVLEFGTNANCAAGTTVLVGENIDSTGVGNFKYVTWGGSASLFSIPISDAFCAVAAGAVVSIDLTFTFIQQ